MSQLVVSEQPHQLVVVWDMDRLLLDVDKAVKAFSDCLPLKSRQAITQMRQEIEASGGSFDVIAGAKEHVDALSLKQARRDFRAYSQNNAAQSLLMPGADRLIKELKSLGLYQLIYTRGTTKDSLWQQDKAAASGLETRLDGYLGTDSVLKAEQLVSYFDDNEQLFHLPNVKAAGEVSSVAARQLIYFDDSRAALGIKEPLSRAASQLRRVWIPAKASERQLTTPEGVLRLDNLSEARLRLNQLTSF